MFGSMGNNKNNTNNKTNKNNVNSGNTGGKSTKDTKWGFAFESFKDSFWSFLYVLGLTPSAPFPVAIVRKLHSNPNVGDRYCSNPIPVRGSRFTQLAYSMIGMAITTPAPMRKICAERSTDASPFSPMRNRRIVISAMGVTSIRSLSRKVSIISFPLPRSKTSAVTQMQPQIIRLIKRKSPSISVFNRKYSG